MFASFSGRQGESSIVCLWLAQIHGNKIPKKSISQLSPLPLYLNLKIPPPTNIQQKIYLYLYNKTKQYSLLTNRNSQNQFVIQNKDSLYARLLSAQNYITENNQLIDYRPKQNIINIKPSIFSLWYSYIGIAGIYNPLILLFIYNFGLKKGLLISLMIVILSAIKSRIIVG